MSMVRTPPFQPGHTFYNGGTIDVTNFGGVQYEGTEYEFNDELINGTPPLSNRSFRIVKRRIVRNMNLAGNMLPRRMVAEVAGSLGGRVAGYSTTLGQNRIWPVDEWLPAAGVPIGDLFYVVTRGPCTVLDAIAADVTTPINQGDTLVALTGSTTGATTSGRVMSTPYSAQTTGSPSQSRGIFGYSMSATTTSNTNTAVLMDFRPLW